MVSSSQCHSPKLCNRITKVRLTPSPNRIKLKIIISKTAFPFRQLFPQTISYRDVAWPMLNCRSTVIVMLSNFSYRFRCSRNRKFNWAKNRICSWCLAAKDTLTSDSVSALPHPHTLRRSFTRKISLIILMYSFCKHNNHIILLHANQHTHTNTHITHPSYIFYIFAICYRNYDSIVHCVFWLDGNDIIMIFLILLFLVLKSCGETSRENTS